MPARSLQFVLQAQAARILSAQDLLGISVVVVAIIGIIVVGVPTPLAEWAA